MRGATVDRQLLWVSAGLIMFGLLTLYSAGQTDVPTRAAGVWHRQFVWVGIGIVAAAVVFHVSPRLLEWLAPALYASACLLLVLVLLVGTGAGTAQSSSSWLSIGGHQIGQPSELAKVATVLMLARYLSSRREPPRSLRDLLVPGIIVGVPFLLVLKQPDLGSAIVFVGIAFAMLFWAGRAAPAAVPAGLPGTEPAAGVQRLDLGRLDGAVHGAAVRLAAVPVRRAGGLVPERRHGGDRAAAVEAAGALPAEPAAHLPQSRGGSQGGGLSRDPVAGRHRFGRVVRHRLHRGAAEAAGVPSRAAHRLRLSHRGRGAGVRRGAAGPGAVPGAVPDACSGSPAGPPIPSAA